MTKAPARLALAAGFAAAAALRLSLLFSYPGNYDTESYSIVADIEARHGNVYAETPRYNYSPVWGWILLGLDRAGRAAGLTLARGVGLFLLAVDAATAFFVARLAAARMGARAGAAAGLLFFANPVSVLISSWHGQFDSFAILFLLVAAGIATRDGEGGAGDPPGTRSHAGRAAALSASLLVKHIGWFHPLLFARRDRPARWIWTVVPYVVFLLSFLPYAASWREIRDHVFRYRSLSGNYGTEALLLIRGVPGWVPSALFAAAVVTAIVFFRRGDPVRASLRLFLVLLVFLPGFSRQYCVWPIALGSILPGAGLLVYTAVSAAFLSRGFFAFDQAPAWLPGWYGPWWGAVLWLLLELRAERRAGHR